MAIVSQSVPVAGEVSALMQVVVSIAKDVKAGKNALAAVGDVLPSLVSAFAGLGDLGSEIANRDAVLNALMINVESVIDVFLAPKS